MKKVIVITIISIMVLTFAGCKKDISYNNDVIQDLEDKPTVTLPPAASPTVAPEQEETNHDGEMKSFLTGQWVPVEIGTRRPYAIQFNNLKLVSNQSGISQADIIYECLVEGGITRLLGIGENYTGDRFGSVRSARHYYVSIADEYDAIYIHFGGTKYAASKIKELGIDEIDGNSGIGSTVFYRDKSIKAPHNAFASLKGILAGIDKKGFETKYSEGYKPHYSFYEKDTDLTAGNPAYKITLKFSAYTSPYLEYNASEKLYYRYQFSRPHKDAVSGSQLSFKNVIIQYVKEWNIDKNGYQTMDLQNAQGSGYYLTNGKAVPITWKKKEASRWMRYYDEAGQELTINPGKTFIALFPNNRTGDVVIED